MDLILYVLPLGAFGGSILAGIVVAASMMARKLEWVKC